MLVNNLYIGRAFLEGGNDLELSKHLSVKHPSLEEILNLGINCENVYWRYVEVLSCDPYHNMVWLDDRGIDFTQMSPFDVFILKWEDAQKQSKLLEGNIIQCISPLQYIKNALYFFLGCHDWVVGQSNDGEIALVDKQNQYAYIDKNIFNYISTFIALINGFNNSNKINIDINDEYAKKMLIESTREEQNEVFSKSKNSDSNDYIGSMISGVVHGGNGGITPLNFKQLKIYQLYSGLTILQKKEHSKHVLNALYAGTLQSKDVNNKELEWIN